MSTAKERVTIRAPLKGWKKDLEVLEAVFGPYGEDAFTPGARVYGNAQVYGDAWVSGPIIAATRTDGYTFVVAHDDKYVTRIIAGCRYFTLDEARPIEPGTQPLAHGQSNRVGRLRAYGNAMHRAKIAQFILAADEAIGALP